MKAYGEYGATATDVVRRGHSPSQERETGKPVTAEDRKKISWTEAYVQLVKGNLGPGCLALPFAFSHCGLMESTITFFVVITIVIFGMVSLVECKRSIRSHSAAVASPETYSEVAFELLGQRGKWTTDLFLVLLQGGVCAVQVDFVSTNLHVILPDISQRMLAFMSLPVFIILSTILSLKRLTPFVTVALAAMVSAVTVVLVLAVSQMYEQGIQTKNLQKWNLMNLPVLFGAVLYAFEGITIVLPIETQMAQPEKIHSVLLSAMGTVAGIFFAVAMLCYLAFGVIQSGSVTAELEWRGVDVNVLTLINLLLVVATVLAYPLQLVPIAEVLEDYLDAKPRQYQMVPSADGSPVMHAEHNVLERRFFRIGITIIAVALAIVFSSRIGLAMALVGSFAGAGLGLVLPTAMNLARINLGDKCGFPMALFNITVMLMGFLGAGIGTGMALVDMIDDTSAS